MPSSSTQAACSSSSSFSDYAEAFAQYVRRLVQTLRPVVVEAAVHSAGYCARLIGEVVRSAQNTARTVLKKLGRPIQNEEIAVPSPQAAAVFSNPNYRASPVQILAQIARGNRDSDANSPARTICTPRPDGITDWERGDHIGKGSFASVYKGYSKEHKLFFAAKGVSLREHRRICHLENEIAILKPLDHENIIKFYGTERGGEMLYIFIELVSHGTLEQAYKNFCFNESQVSDYTRQILQGLTYLHSCKVVHGDVKCANILVTELGRIKLADFVAKLKRVGYGFPSDIWSLGCTVTELSTRKYPQYNARDRVSLDRAIRSGEGPVVPDYLSDTLKDFINQCLQPDPYQRPTAADLLAHRFVNESSCPQPDLTELLF
ncbi:hypothetical protein OIU84_027992 [Salix udensis]|uniref:mitogen-activated protein kinase kinase kinase n=1 Tax=Salix udensis TaxID=889485 RepID=A0AAD6KDX8_9ROSI|nr:hypothetical protein OIU84_027992 [Salix udensis]